MIYSNITLPPVREITAAKPLVGYLAPIDFDPIHGMDDPRSAPRREFKEIMYEWTKVMEGRLVIYDYDQSMLVWRDLPMQDRVKNPGHWEQLRTDLYAQAQGVVTEDFQSYTGHAWYQTDLELDANQAQGALHLRFPGLFNECWLYVNGEQLAHREFKGVWWMNDYRFEWDVDLKDKLKTGTNSIVLRLHNPHHFGGIFRRPFLYRATGQ